MKFVINQALIADVHALTHALKQVRPAMTGGDVYVECRTTRQGMSAFNGVNKSSVNSPSMTALTHIRLHMSTLETSVL